MHMKLNENSKMEIRLTRADSVASRNSTEIRALVVEVEQEIHLVVKHAKETGIVRSAITATSPRETSADNAMPTKTALLE